MSIDHRSDRESLLHLVSRVKPRDARTYASANGWIRKSQDYGGLAVFDHHDRELTQLLIPIETTSCDYASLMLDVVERLAEVEDRSIIEVANDLLDPDSDVVRYRISDPTISADLGLLKGIETLEGAKRSLLAAAHSVLKPATYHPRLSRREATEFVDRCRLKQTEHGSFVVAIACPLDAVDAEGLLRGGNSFTRQVTSLLMESLIRIEERIDADDEASLTVATPEKAPVTANLCDALSRLEPPSDQGSLEISATWASTTPNPDAPQRRVVRLTEDHFKVIRAVGLRLRPSHEAEVANFVGQVETLNGDLNDHGRRYGEVILDLLVDDELVRTRVEL
ncbi:MAG: hypothetical protein WD049_00355, partial [Candidatus Paceibacterota bacterium]